MTRPARRMVPLWRLRALLRPQGRMEAVIALRLDQHGSERTWTVLPPMIRSGDVVVLEGEAFHLTHVAVPPRSGVHYHFLVQDEAIPHDRLLVLAVRRLLDVDPRAREAVACRSLSCELTSHENVVES